jgi:C1A family cysteine protease
VGFAAAQSIYVSLKKIGILLPDFPSPQGIYTFARCIDRISNDTPLSDDGSSPNQAMRGITEWGVPIMSDWPFDVATINDEPNLGEIEHASSLRMLGYYRIDNNSTVGEMFKSAIAAGYPVPLATQVDQAFEDYNGHGSVTTPGESLGGHYVCGVGYETMPSGKTVYEFVNSWGESWGDKGCFYADEPWLKNTTDRYVMNLHRTK